VIPQTTTFPENSSQNLGKLPPIVSPSTQTQTLEGQNISNLTQENTFVNDSNNTTSPMQNNEERSPTQQTPCRYAEKCYRKNSEHFKKYSHPVSVNASDGAATKRITCKYGEKCYRKNSLYLETYSHSDESQNPINDQSTDMQFQQDNQNQNTDSEMIADLKVELEVQQQIAQIHLELVEKQFLESIADLQNKNKYLKEEMKKLNEDKMKIATYHQQLECALAQELDNRERREIEKKRILEIRRDTPKYWGTNAFDQPYREIEIRQGTPEFISLCGLLNNTIETHGNKYGTIYGKDPTEFIVTRINRIHNKKLWHEYCFKKVNMTSV
jgi:hypothetical protein